MMLQMFTGRFLIPLLNQMMQLIRGIPYYFTEPKTSPSQNDSKIFTYTLTCFRNIFKISDPTPTQIIAFLSFPYFRYIVFLQSTDTRYNSNIFFVNL